MAVTSMSRSSVSDFQKANVMSGPGAKTIDVGYIVAASGGGGGGSTAVSYGGGAGAGAGGLSKGDASYTVGSSFTVTVGAGGAINTDGNKTVFDGVSQAGGGAGGNASTSLASAAGNNGGCGGGAGSDDSAANPNIGIGFVGFDGGETTAADGGGAGGGGMGAVGGNGAADDGGVGGNGLTATQITDSEATSLSVGEVSGSDVYFCGGGGGGTDGIGNTPGSGGLGGGGTGGSDTVAAVPGDANTGGGGGGSSRGLSNASAGGSGVVVLKYPSTYTLTIGAGLTSTTITSGSFKVTALTAGSDTVTIG